MGKKQKIDDKKNTKDKNSNPKQKIEKDKNIKKNVTPVVKIIDKKAVVDQYMKNRNEYHIYPDENNYFNGKFFSCTLNKSDLNKNNNKYYIIQLLEHDTNGSLVLFLRWGRVGVPGNTKTDQVDKISGPKLFMKKYNDKTKNHSYQEIFIDYETEVQEDELPKILSGTNKPKKKFQNTLSKEVMELIKLIYDKKMINDNLHEIGYDSKKMPLGKLSPATLTHGLNILKKIEEELNNKNPKKENLIKLSSEFYS